MIGTALLVLAAFLAEGDAASSGRPSPSSSSSPFSSSSSWDGAWTFDSCHEDRKADHDKETFCREGVDRILITRDHAGRPDITLCPADPWGERDVTIGPGSRLTFRTRDGLAMQLELSADGAHFRGVFRSRDGHSGRAWGRRVAGCK